jgi:major membrane immunogen (membrane-anchored lipoprotein)
VVRAEPTQPNQIQAISGATISSDALTTIVNDTVEMFRKALEAEEEKEAGNGQ